CIRRVRGKLQRARRAAWRIGGLHRKRHMIRRVRGGQRRNIAAYTGRWSRKICLDVESIDHSVSASLESIDAVIHASRIDGLIGVDIVSNEVSRRVEAGKYSYIVRSQVRQRSSSLCDSERGDHRVRTGITAIEFL